MTDNKLAKLTWALGRVASHSASVSGNTTDLKLLKRDLTAVRELADEWLAEMERAQPQQIKAEKDPNVWLRAPRCPFCGSVARWLRLPVPDREHHAGCRCGSEWHDVNVKEFTAGTQKREECPRCGSDRRAVKLNSCHYAVPHIWHDVRQGDPGELR